MINPANFFVTTKNHHKVEHFGFEICLYRGGKQSESCLKIRAIFVCMGIEITKFGVIERCIRKMSQRERERERGRNEKRQAVFGYN